MSGKRVAWYFITFFGFIAAVNTVMVTLAIRTHSGTVTEHPYEKGLAYNQVVDAKKKQEELGWKGAVELRHSLESGSPSTLFFELRDNNGAVINPTKVTATITRPTQSGMDFTAALNATQTPITFPAKGIWHVRVNAVVGNKIFQQSKRVVVE
jgi:nitrogen fixation protein FixH